MFKIIASAITPIMIMIDFFLSIGDPPHLIAMTWGLLPSALFVTTLMGLGMFKTFEIIEGWFK